jgi:hypothetical protein
VEKLKLRYKGDGCWFSQGLEIDVGFLILSKNYGARVSLLSSSRLSSLNPSERK